MALEESNARLSSAERAWQRPKGQCSDAHTHGLPCPQSGRGRWRWVLLRSDALWRMPQVLGFSIFTSAVLGMTLVPQLQLMQV